MVWWWGAVSSRDTITAASTAEEGCLHRSNAFYGICRANLLHSYGTMPNEKSSGECWVKVDFFVLRFIRSTRYIRLLSTVLGLLGVFFFFGTYISPGKQRRTYVRV